MSLQGRVEKLERAAGVDDGELCACLNNQDVRAYMGEGTSVADARADTRPAEVCGRCGRPKQILKLIVCYADEDVRLSA